MAAVVDERFLLSDRQRDDLLNRIGQCPRNGRPLRAFLSSVALAALRPHEALALRVRDANLPNQGPGELMVLPGRLRSGDEAVEGVGVVRVVPASPELVEILKAEVARRGLGPADLMFTRDDGRPLPGAVYRKAWRSAREAVLEPHEFSSPLGRRVSDLRDTCIATWLSGHRTAWDISNLADRTGISVSALARRFPHRFQPPASAEASNALIEAAFGTAGPERAPTHAAR
ncbi:hypothetical protein OG711_09720 [Streptomyces uncialis]|uniref:hypothetical protein n=1 Tax=Streptomyces uncialis TaxID=1048205 RepID=UPI002E3223A0|nr:hypothetical protein [Streptomyces uncialis]